MTHLLKKGEKLGIRIEYDFDGLDLEVFTCVPPLNGSEVEHGELVEDLDTKEDKKEKAIVKLHVQRRALLLSFGVLGAAGFTAKGLGFI